MRICLVDDNEAVLDALALWLRDAGDEILLARTGAEALLLLQEDAPDLVIADVNLPDINGVSLAHEMRKLRSALVIVLMSGQAHLAPGAVGPDAADVFLTKPFTPKTLVAAVLRAQELRAAA